MRNILVTTYWSYKDPLIQTYTLPYLKIIANQGNNNIHLVTIEQERLNMSPEERKEVEIELSKYNISLVSLPYSRIGLKMYIKLIWFLFKLVSYTFKHKITHIHGWCTPGGAIAYILSVLTGKPFNIDSYEPHAEAMVENGTWTQDSFAYRILSKFEKWQTNRAKNFISAASTMKKYAKDVYKRDISDDRFFVKPACVDLDLFSYENRENIGLKRKLGLEDKLVCVYAGKFGGIYLENEVFDFFKVAEDFWGDKFRVLLLTNHSDEEVIDYCKGSGFDYSKVIKKFVPHSEVANYMGIADFGLTPVKPVPTKQHCTPIKDGEYWALGLPVVITKNISDDSQIIEENEIGAVLKEFGKKEYLCGVQKIDELLKNNTKRELYDKIRNIAVKYRSFDIAKKVYSQVYTVQNG